MATNLASTNPQIRQLCSQGLDLLLSTLNSPRSSFTRDVQLALLQPYTQVALFENAKIRALMLDKLMSLLACMADAAEEANQAPALAAFKPAVPVAYALLDESNSKSELRAPLLRTAQMLYAMLGPQLWDDKLCMQFHISSQQVNKLKQALNVA